MVPDNDLIQEQLMPDQLNSQTKHVPSEQLRSTCHAYVYCRHQVEYEYDRSTIQVLVC
jgi:hypothetical protein